MSQTIDFQAVASSALPHMESLCMELLPGGKKTGREYVCAGPDGGKGRSFSVNTQTGAWGEFSGNDKGGDAVSLVACIRQTNQAEAAKWLTDRLSLNGFHAPAKPAKPSATRKATHAPTPTPPAPSVMSGLPVSASWFYHDAQGRAVGLVCRAEVPGDKIIRPFIWSGSAWVPGGMPSPRPLYCLPALLANPSAPVLLVEGEKTADAARKLLDGTPWQVTTWANGASSFDLADITPLTGRTVVMWPDNDEAGRKCAAAVAAKIPNVRIVTPPEGVRNKWDLADALADGWTGSEVMEFLDLAAAPERELTPEEKRVASIMERAAAFAFDPAKPPERRPPIVTLNGHPVCKKGDLMVFMAPNKSGKSSSLAAMLASTFAAPGSDCLGFEAANPDCESVVHLMTEESIEDHWDMVNRSLRRGKVSIPPPWFSSYHLRRFNTDERRSFLFAKARASKPLRLLILDGAADFVEDSNDLAECKRFVDELLTLIDELQCAVAVTIHVNPSIKPTERDKGMGHLGSIFERKASSILLLKKEEKEGIGEVITINTKDARKGKAACPPRFVWSEEHSMHVRYIGPTDIVSTIQKQPGRARMFTWEKLTTYFVEGMRPVEEWQESDMASLAQRAGCSAATVRRMAAKHLAEEGGFIHE